MNVVRNLGRTHADLLIVLLLLLGAAQLLEPTAVTSWTADRFPPAPDQPADLVADLELQLASALDPMPEGQLLVVGFDVTAQRTPTGFDVPPRFTWLGGDVGPGRWGPRPINVPGGSSLQLFGGIDLDRNGRLDGADLVSRLQTSGSPDRPTLTLHIDAP